MMRYRPDSIRPLASLLMAALLFLSSASQSQETVAQDVSPVSPGIKFETELFKAACQVAPAENCILSPLSIRLALDMTVNGADGETLKAMASTLGFKASELAQHNQSERALLSGLTAPSTGAELILANSLWGRKDIPFAQPFLRVCRDFYQADLTSLDLASMEAKESINTWIANKTNGRITQILGKPLDGNTLLLLINALYFKGLWALPFDPAETREDAFVGADGSEKTVPFMNQTGKFNYQQNEAFSSISLAYGSGEMSMDFYLPAEGKSLDDLIASLSPALLHEAFGKYHQRRGRIQIPRLKLESDMELSSPLSNMGMKVAFDPNLADFRGMVPLEVFNAARPFIKKVLHKTFLEVNEKGAEAAASTAVVLELRSMSRPFEFVLNRPFLFLIRDCRNREIILIGAARKI